MQNKIFFLEKNQF